jgi:hypothetical protein
MSSQWDLISTFAASLETRAQTTLTVVKIMQIVKVQSLIKARHKKNKSFVQLTAKSIGQDWDWMKQVDVYTRLK